MHYLLYKEMSFLATLASLSFFKRSGTYNLYRFGRVGYKNNVKTVNKYGSTFLMQASDCVINYLNKNKFLLPYLQSVILFGTFTSKNAIFICLGEISFLCYTVGKLIFCLQFLFEFCTL